MLEFITRELESLKEAGLYRDIRIIEKVEGSNIWINGKKLANFSSNNYLGLSSHPKVIEKARSAISEFGAGSGASRLISGNIDIHNRLESKIAQFKFRESALVFPTGYMANIGVISSLLSENDTVIVDRLCHASIIDGCRLTRAKLQIFRHRDMQSLQSVLSRSKKFRKKLIITDSIFSMDGDIAPLAEIVRLAKKHQALTMIDEAHATGVLGKGGHGLEEHFNLVGSTDIIMGTLSKAVGSLGGFAAGSQALIAYLRNKARSFIYTTALPPSECAAALAAIDIIETEPQHLDRLRQNIHYLSSLLSPHYQGEEEPLSSEQRKNLSPIIPIIIGCADKTMEISQKLFDRGFFVSGIRPPTVPKGKSRLRVTITANHRKEELECLAFSLRELIPA